MQEYHRILSVTQDYLARAVGELRRGKNAGESIRRRRPLFRIDATRDAGAQEASTFNLDSLTEGESQPSLTNVSWGRASNPQTNRTLVLGSTSEFNRHRPMLIDNAGKVSRHKASSKTRPPEMRQFSRRIVKKRYSVVLPLHKKLSGGSVNEKKKPSRQMLASRGRADL